MRTYRHSKRSRTQNNEGHKSQFPPYNSSIPPMLQRGNPAHYLNWWFPAHITAQSLSHSCLYATHFICRCACACRKWRFVIGHIRPKPNNRRVKGTRDFLREGARRGIIVRIKLHIWRAGIASTSAKRFTVCLTSHIAQIPDANWNLEMWRGANLSNYIVWLLNKEVVMESFGWQ